VLVVTRSEAIPVLNRILVAPVTRTIRGIPTEVLLGSEDGLPETSVASFDNLQPVPKSFLTSRLGSIWHRRHEICSALEALRAMEGKDGRKWREHDVRRYSAGHSYLKDGEQCLIPALIAQRASAIGLYVKSVITWAKRGSLPEPQHSRVSRSLEYIIHITKNRTPKFSRESYHVCDPIFGGRNPECESEKLSDVWVLATSGGGNGHGAQFPVALPGRCIALCTEPGDLVLDPFVGTGNSGIAAGHHGCAFLGFDVSEKYLSVAENRMRRQSPKSTLPDRYRLVV